MQAIFREMYWFKFGKKLQKEVKWDNIQRAYHVVEVVAMEVYAKNGWQFLFRLCEWYELSYNLEQFTFIIFQIFYWHDDVIIDNDRMHWMM